MKAIVLKEFGDTENLLYKEIEMPLIGANEVLVKVKAISINPVDYKVRNRQAPLAEDLAHFDPLILGWDISGEVVAAGTAVTEFTIGEEVFGMVNFVGHGKACHAVKAAIVLAAASICVMFLGFSAK